MGVYNQPSSAPALFQNTRNALHKLKAWLPEPVRRFFREYVRPYLPDVSFVTLHYLYFITTCLLASIIFWGSSTPSRSVSYVDSLFLAVSAMTEAGLNTVNLSTLNTWQQIMLFVLIMMGSAIFVSSAVLHIRKSAFERQLEVLAEKRKRHLHLSRSFTRTFRSRRRDSSAAREHAIVSGAVRGRAIKDSEARGDPGLVADLEREPIGNGLGHPPASPERAHDPLPMDRTSPRTETGHITFGSDVRLPPVITGASPTLRRTTTRLFTGSGVGARSLDNHPRNALPIHRLEDGGESPSENSALRPASFSTVDKWIQELGGYIGRNSQFHNLTEKERRRLGGIEYEAITVLSYVVPVYFVCFQFFGAIGMGAYMQLNRPDIALTNGLNPFWTGAFFAISAFNNSGMALLDANAVALQTSYYGLLTLSLLILAGNTCFPPFLRLIIWCMKISIPESTDPAPTSGRALKWQKRRRVLTFILDHPRRVYTNLFPAAQTWWLVASLFILNGVDWLAFEVLNIGNPTTDVLAPHYRVLDGLFQAFAVRSGGFYVVNISGLRSGLLILYVLMMYVSALPVTMTIRNTNVYEERSLGIFAEDLPQQPADPESGNPRGGTPQTPTQPVLDPDEGPGMLSKIKRAVTSQHGTSGRPAGSWSRQDFIRQQLHGQLGHDLWWLALAVLFIAIIETGQFERNPVVFATFNIVFEVVSAYGCVGISTGVPWNAYSFCGAWHTGSKLILCAVMLRGRHRGLPVAIDKAVLLPSETLAWAEEEDAARRRDVSRMRERRGSTNSEWARSLDVGRNGEGLRRTVTGLSMRSERAGHDGSPLERQRSGEVGCDEKADAGKTV